MKEFKGRVVAPGSVTAPAVVSHYGFNTLASLQSALQFGDKKATCGDQNNADIHGKALAGKADTRILLEENKGHNPNYTADAVKYLGEYTAEMTRLLKDRKLSTEAEKKAFREKWDWNRMTRQDEKVWAEIFKTLDA